MHPVLFQTARILALAVCACGWLGAQTIIHGRVVDENGTGVAGARVEFRTGLGLASVASTDAAGNFRATVPKPGEYAVRVERLGFFVFDGKPQPFEEQDGPLTIRLNHLQEFADKVDVVYSPP